MGAFVLPARDAMLTRVAAGNLGRAVAIMTATQFGSQLVGIASGAAAETVGAPALLLVQAGMLALGGLAAMQLPPASPAAAPVVESRLAAMLDGLREGARSAVIAPVLVAQLAVGVLYVGALRDPAAHGPATTTTAVRRSCRWYPSASGAAPSPPRSRRSGWARSVGRAAP